VIIRFVNRLRMMGRWLGWRQCITLSRWQTGQTWHSTNRTAGAFAPRAIGK